MRVASAGRPRRLSSPDLPLGWTGSLRSAAWAEPLPWQPSLRDESGNWPLADEPHQTGGKSFGWGAGTPPWSPSASQAENSIPVKTCLRVQCDRRAWKPSREGTGRGHAGTVASQQTRSPPGPPPASTRLHAHGRARLLTPDSSSCFICLDVFYLPKVYETLSSTKSLFPVPLLLEVSCPFLSCHLLGSRMDEGCEFGLTGPHCAHTGKAARVPDK